MYGCLNVYFSKIRNFILKVRYHFFFRTQKPLNCNGVKGHSYVQWQSKEYNLIKDWSHQNKRRRGFPKLVKLRFSSLCSNILRENMQCKIVIFFLWQIFIYAINPVFFYKQYNYLLCLWKNLTQTCLTELVDYLIKFKIIELWMDWSQQILKQVKSSEQLYSSLNRHH